MIVARMILVSAMLTACIVETTKTAMPRPAEGGPAAAPASTVPAVDPACAGAAWPYLPGACLRSDGPADGAARRPVRVIEERRPAAPVRLPGRVSVG
ncbi:hypothetical protein NS228_02615 [Methylobacterium indicum]|uniref:Lipoprotein n=1 Tax=Methylobacterium indicum TaxID=1775910 RepID=A0A8H8WU82_9HYPH|nr:hypothetical protein [Methylobacterium indicum]KMO20439.1 hypothetical protein QR79_18160 [Methylobacterium indicum]KTS32226.1 hypothetical protein NS229_13250 [Methylobacterium indicum]KTS42415.1 hypothetical protein NS228_02615 [Methylobacterium indicum]KTS53997.1 hypothetical protein NS230_03250 [Methylobacterium indicum]BCM84506.1 hypothetical protein mvi_29670 [Methylobacterium indicum]